MATFNFTAPDGSKYIVNGPDDATEEQAFAILQQQLQSGTAKSTATDTTAQELDDQLARANTALINAGRNGQLSNDTTAQDGTPSYLQTPTQTNPFIPNQVAQISQDVTGRDPNAAADQAGIQMTDELRKPFMAEAKKLVGKDEYRGMTQSQIADQLATANYQGNAAEGLFTVATLPFTGGSTLLGRIGLQAGLAGTGAAINQAVDSAVSGQDRSNIGEIGTSAGFGALGGAIGEGIARGGSAAIRQAARWFGDDATRATLADNTMARRAAKATTQDVIDSVDQGVTAAQRKLDDLVNSGASDAEIAAARSELEIAQQRQAVNQEAIVDADGNSLDTPNSVLTGNSLLARSLRAAENRGAGTGRDTDFTNRYETRNSGESLTRAGNKADELGAAQTGSNPNLQDTLSDASDLVKSQTRDLYNTSKQAAQDILDSQRITSIKLPSTKTMASGFLDNNKSMGGSILTNGTKKILNQLNNAKIKNIDNLDQFKRTLSEQANKDYLSKDYQSSTAAREVLNSLRNEADDLVSRISPDAQSIYRQADQHFADITPYYGNKSPLSRIVGDENVDTAANAVLNGQNARYNAEVVGRGLTQSNQRATAEANSANNLFRSFDNTNVDEAAAREIAAREAQAAQDIQTRTQNNALNYSNALGSEIRDRAATAAGRNGDFNLRTYANTLNQKQPSLQEAQAVSDAARTPGNYALNQNAINQQLADTANRFANTTRAPQGPQSLIPKDSVGAAALDLALTGGAATIANVAKRALVDTGALDKLMRQGARARKYVDYVNNPANSEKIASYIANSRKAAEDWTPTDIKNMVDTFGDFTRSLNVGGQARAVNAFGQESQTQQPQAPVQTPTTQPAVQGGSTLPTQPATVIAPRSIPVVSVANDALYHGLTQAETGGIDDPWIRTRAKDSSTDLGSSAYGPAQITGSLMQDAVTRHPEMFTDEEMEYARNFIDQARIMLRRPNDPVFGYGKSGVLGSTPYLRQQYETIAKKLIDMKWKEAGGDYNKFIQSWRGLHDPKYVAKVDKAVNNYLDDIDNSQVG